MYAIREISTTTTYKKDLTSRPVDDEPGNPVFQDYKEPIKSESRDWFSTWESEAILYKTKEEAEKEIDSFTEEFFHYDSWSEPSIVDGSRTCLSSTNNRFDVIDVGDGSSEELNKLLYAD